MNRERFCLGVVMVVALLGGCSTYPKKVDCEAHLRAINSPAPSPSKEAVP